MVIVLRKKVYIIPMRNVPHKEGTSPNILSLSKRLTLSQRGKAKRQTEKDELVEGVSLDDNEVTSHESRGKSRIAEDEKRKEKTNAKPELSFVGAQKTGETTNRAQNDFVKGKKKFFLPIVR